MDGGQTTVWDPLVRIVHWGLAALVAVELVNEAGANPWHRYLGYAAAALIVMRLGWGLAASGYARLSTIAASAGRAAAYLQAPRPATPPAGLNPLGALMAFALWGLVLLVALTGWMQRLDSLWGEEWLQDVHAGLAYALAAFIAVHVCGVLVTSRAQGENLVKAMITGNKLLRGR